MEIKDIEDRISQNKIDEIFKKGVFTETVNDDIMECPYLGVIRK